MTPAPPAPPTTDAAPPGVPPALPPSPGSPPGPPPSPRIPRRRIVGGLAAAAALALGSLLYAEWERVLDGVAEVGHAVAKLGVLAWQDPSGEWVTIGPADAHRRQWGPTDVFLTPRWVETTTGLELADLYVRRDPNPQTIDLVLARLDPKRWRLRVLGTPAWDAETVARFAATEHLSLAVNAAYFSDEGPLGLVVSDGVRRHRDASHRAAHFVSEGAGLVPRILNDKHADVGDVDQAFQGFPAIMTDGRTYGYMRVGGRGFDVWKVDRRTAGCVTRDDHLILLVTDSLTNGLSLDELATVLGGLGCVDAMGFDGGSSTSMSIRVKGHAREVPGLREVQVVLGATPHRRSK